jgi:N utilization substance protein B
MGVRRKGREYALQMLFAMDLTEYQPDAVFAGYHTIQDLNRDAFFVARRVVDDIYGHIQEIDGALSGYAKNWKIPRMAVVDRNLLRLGLYEIMFHPETPFPVILHEALEICEEFSEADSCQFVKGILDAAGRDLRPNDVGRKAAKKKEADAHPKGEGGEKPVAADATTDAAPGGEQGTADKDSEASKDGNGGEDCNDGNGGEDGKDGGGGEDTEGSQNAQGNGGGEDTEGSQNAQDNGDSEGGAE